MRHFDRIHTYNPFVENIFAFYHQFSYNSTSFSVDPVTNVDLYFQPLQYPPLAIVFFIARVIIIFAGEYVQINLLALFRRESCLVNEVLKIVTYIQMGYWPLFVLFETTTDFINPLREIVGEWYCVIAFFVIVYGMTHIVFHSFTVALMRYTFVVHHERVARFGKERSKRYFLVMSIVVPIVATIWRFLGRLEVSAISSLNKCNGIHHMSFLIENGIGSTVDNNFCFREEYDDEIGNKPLALFKRGLCVMSSVLYLIMGFNVVEGVFYWRTLVHSKK